MKEFCIHMDIPSYFLSKVLGTVSDLANGETEFNWRAELWDNGPGSWKEHSRPSSKWHEWYCPPWEATETWGCVLSTRLTRDQWPLPACESQTGPAPSLDCVKHWVEHKELGEPHEGDTEFPTNQVNGGLSQVSLWEKIKTYSPCTLTLLS